MISIYPIGTLVCIGNKKKRDMEVEIIAVCITTKGVEYRVNWWKGDELKDCWINQDQIEVKRNIKKIEIGFTTNE